MGMKKIYVGSEHRRAFESICRVIEGHCLDDLGYTVRGNVICDGVYEYEMSDHADRSENVEKFHFAEDGATWFRPLRGVSAEDDNAIWASFRETVKDEYHKRFSVMEYERRRPGEAEWKRAEGQIRWLSDEFTRLFYPDFYRRTEVRPIAEQDTSEEVFGVAMRIELAAPVTSGASLPILCKVYFTKSDRTVRVMHAEAAEGLDRMIAGMVSDGGEGGDDVSAVASEGVISAALNGLDKMVKDPTVNFADYILIGDPEDRRAVENLRRQMSHDSFELECQRLDVLYISHIKANAFVYDVYSGSSPLFRLSLGMDGSFSVFCLNCGKNECLVDRNEIVYRVGEEQRSAKLMMCPDLGLSGEQMADIRLHSTLGDHFMRISCPFNRRNPGCNKLKCRAHTFEVTDEQGKLVHKCADCPYPEVVYTTLEGERKFTPTMLFATDRLELLEPKEQEMKKCTTCGRFFTAEAMEGGRCEICAFSGKPDAQSQKIYKKYRTMLPIGTRMLSAFSPKSAVEDDELILFIVGNKRYLFNKLDAKQTGYLKAPHKIP